MRKAAGILTIIAGLASSVAPYSFVHDMALRRTDSPDAAYSFIVAWNGVIVLSGILILVLTIGGGVCALRGKAWLWALSGAVCCMIAMTFYSIFFALPGLLAVIFLAIRRSEF